MLFEPLTTPISVSRHLKIACVNIEHTCTKDNVMSLLTCLCLQLQVKGWKHKTCLVASLFLCERENKDSCGDKANNKLPSDTCCQPNFHVKRKNKGGCENNHLVANTLSTRQSYSWYLV